MIFHVPRLLFNQKTSCESIVYLIFELAKTSLNIAFGCLKFD